MTAVLYAVPGSHPCAAVEKALQLKGIAYRRVELIPIAHRLPTRLRFGVGSVPALILEDGTRVSGSRTILRALEERVPQPALLPADKEARALVERAEEWGDQVLQPLVRRVVWAALRRAPGAIESFTAQTKLPLPPPLARAGRPVVARMAQRLVGASDATVRADLISLPGHLDRIDRWIADGTLGGVSANVADLQIGSSLRLLATVRDLGPLLDARSAGALARRWFPVLTGEVPAGTLPRAWVASAEERQLRQ